MDRNFIDFSENIRSEKEKSPNKIETYTHPFFNNNFNQSPDKSGQNPSYEELQQYFEDSLRKQIYTQYLLGIFKLHCFKLERDLEYCRKSFFIEILCKKEKKNTMQKKNRELQAKIDHFSEQIANFQIKEKEMRENPSFFNQNDNFEKKLMEIKNELIHKSFDINLNKKRQGEDDTYFELIKKNNQISEYLLIEYEDFLIKEHKNLFSIEKSMKIHEEKLNKEKNELENIELKNRELEKLEKFLLQEEKIIDEEKKKMQMDKNFFLNFFEIIKELLITICPEENYRHKNGLHNFLQEIIEIYEQNELNYIKKNKFKDLKRKFNEISKDFDDNEFEKLGKFDIHKEFIKKDEILQKNFERKEEMLKTKQSELEALKKLLEKEALILQEEKKWFEIEKRKIGEKTKKKISSLEQENSSLKMTINQLTNISLNKTLEKQEKSKKSAKMELISDDFEISKDSHNIFNPNQKEIIFESLCGWFDYSIKLSKKDVISTKRRVFEKWKIISLYISDLISNKDYLGKKWYQNKKILENEGRYPYNKLSKKKKEIEETIFDYERKSFWQTRFYQLFSSILRNRRRREKIIIAIGFYKFCINGFLTYKKPRYDFEHSRNIKEETYFNNPSLKKKLYSNKQSEEINEKPLKTRKNDENSMNSQFDNSKPRSFGAIESPFQKIATDNSLISSKRFTEPLFEKKHLILLRIIFKKSFVEEAKFLRKCFSKWLQFCLKKEKIAVNEELKEIGFILEELVYRTNEKSALFSLKRNEIDSKISMIFQILTCFSLKPKKLK